MHDEDDFLRKLLESPADDTLRLVYADWLDERNDPADDDKSAFIRLELRMAAAHPESRFRPHFTSQLQKLAVRLDRGWLAVVSHPKLEACRLAFRFECPKQWEKLTATDDANVRHCASCDRTVHYCDTIADAQDHAEMGDCVAVSLALVRRPNDLYPRRTMLAGIIAPHIPPEVDEPPAPPKPRKGRKGE